MAKRGRKGKTTLYLCNNQRCKDMTPAKCLAMECYHTTEEKYAKNTPVLEPELYPDRFMESKTGDFWEYDDNTPLPVWLIADNWDLHKRGRK